MSKSVRKVPKDRVPQWKLDLMLLRDKLEEESIIIERERVDPHPVLFSHEQYDTLNPELKLKAFCGEIRDMLARYEGDKVRYDQLEQEMQDLLHYIEMAGDKNANVGFKLYKRMAEVRRERRICKNEIDLLQPIYDNFQQTDLLNILSRIQGTCKSVKQTIDGKAYTVRTDVLNDFIK